MQESALSIDLNLCCSECVCVQFQQQPSDMPLKSYVWDVNNPNTPEFEMAPNSQICCAKFNLKDHNIIGAGQYNGQFTFYDLRKGSSAVDATPIDVSHRDPVYDMVGTSSIDISLTLVSPPPLPGSIQCLVCQLRGAGCPACTILSTHLCTTHGHGWLYVPEPSPIATLQR